LIKLCQNIVGSVFFETQCIISKSRYVSVSTTNDSKMVQDGAVLTMTGR